MSNSSSGVAQRYARSILNSTKSIYELEAVFSELQLVLSILSNFTDLWDYLASGFVSAREKLSTWEKISFPVSSFTVAALSLMITNHRLNLLTEVIRQLEVELCSMKNSIKVQIKTASVLDDTTKSRIKDCLKDLFTLDVIPNFTIDHSLVGGFIAYGDSIMLDMSYKKRINQLKKAFKIV